MGEKTMELLLASASPRRQELLQQLGLSFQVETSSFDEKEVPCEGDPGVYAKALALGKAREVASRFPEAMTLGADTIVILDGQILNKPLDEEDAKAMLRRLGGRSHQVITAVALCRKGGEEYLVDHEETQVTFRTLSEGEIQAYVASGEPLDKAGAYGIQKLGALLVASIEGDYFNVVGLPLVKAFTLLGRWGIHILPGEPDS